MTRSYGESVQVPKAAELVASSIRTQIVRGTIRDGENLPPESDLMSQFGVSRPTLREALRVLESENLISVRRGAKGGASAHGMTAALVSRYAAMLLESRGATIADVYGAQLTFEPACVRKLAETRTEHALGILRQTIDDERLTVNETDDSVMRIEFHHLLIELSGNQTLLLLSELISSMLIAAATGEDPIGIDQKTAFADHERLVELIAAGDGDSAHDLWLQHLENAQRRILDQLGSDRRVVLLD